MTNAHSRRLIALLTLGVFGILNTEMGIVGILPLIAEQYGVTIATAGWLVSGFAVMVAIGGPTMPLLCAPLNRKTLMLLSGGLFTLCNLLAAFAPNFAVLLLARVLPAIFHPAYVSMALTEAGKAVCPDQAAKAVAQVFIGVSAGMVLGVPVTNLMAAHFSLRAALLFLAAVNALAFVLTLVLVPSLPAHKPRSISAPLNMLKKPALLLSLAVVVFLNGAIFGFYSYLSDFYGSVTRLSPTTISAFLMLYGAANIIGNLLAGKALSSHAAKTILLLPFVLLGAYGLLFAGGQSSAVVFFLSVLLGALAGINTNANQYLISQSGQEAPELANGLYLTAANLGTTIGTFLCGLFITAWGTRYALGGAMLFLLLGLLALSLKLALEKRLSPTAALRPKGI